MNARAFTRHIDVSFEHTFDKIISVYRNQFRSSDTQRRVAFTGLANANTTDGCFCSFMNKLYFTLFVLIYFSIRLQTNAYINFAKPVIASTRFTVCVAEIH